jgi:polyribonucleotide nucleotidyltransferase
MDKALAEPRADLSPYAPRIVTLQINPEKIGDLIGPKGKTIRGASRTRRVAELHRRRHRPGVDRPPWVARRWQRARQMVQAITAEPEIGAGPTKATVHDHDVRSERSVGSCLGPRALVHISELKHGRTDKTEDQSVNKGDRVHGKAARPATSVDACALSMMALVRSLKACPGRAPSARGPRGRRRPSRPRSENGGDRPRRSGGGGRGVRALAPLVGRG